MPNWFQVGCRASNWDSRFPRDLPLRDVRYAAVDTELTSLDKRSNRLLSIGAIAMDGPKIRMAEQFYRVVNPGVHVPAESVLIHKLRPNDVEQGVAPENVVASHVTSGKTDRTRPLCAYPREAKWNGSGSTDQADNFSCVLPSKP